MERIDRVNELHAFYDGVIPDPIREAALGSREMVAYLQAVGTVEFYRGMTRNQVDLIRQRQQDGSFQPYMLNDLRLYVSEWRKWRLARERLAKAVSKPGDHGIAA